MRWKRWESMPMARSSPRRGAQPSSRRGLRSASTPSTSRRSRGRWSAWEWTALSPTRPISSWQPSLDGLHFFTQSWRTVIGQQQNGHITVLRSVDRSAGFSGRLLTMTRILLSSVATAAVLASASSASAQTEIQWWHAMGGNLGETVNALAEGFNKTQTDYKVVPVYKGSYT